MATSPYHGRPSSRWPSITRELVAAHPLTAKLIIDAALTAWDTLWDTTIGTGRTSIAMVKLRVPATVVGYFFEVLLARELETRRPGEWRSGRSKDDKDLVFVANPDLSVEVKTSGQAG